MFVNSIPKNNHAKMNTEQLKTYKKKHWTLIEYEDQMEQIV